ncbi:MAG: hypothetical protein L6Q71_03285 [Planctomycetes bacterium]|nr:hypothetical protein [Planctomycetota bacterium]
MIVIVSQLLLGPALVVLLILALPQTDPNLFWTIAVAFFAFTPLRMGFWLLWAFVRTSKFQAVFLLKMEYELFAGFGVFLYRLLLFPLLIFGVVVTIWKPHEHSLWWSAAPTAVLGFLYLWHRKVRRREKAEQAKIAPKVTAATDQSPQVEEVRPSAETAPKRQSRLSAEKFLSPASSFPVTEKKEREYDWLQPTKPPIVRNGWLSVLLLVSTFGVYSFVWLWNIHNEHPGRKAIDPSAAKVVWGTLIPALIGVALLLAGGIPLPNKPFTPHENTAAYWGIGYGFLLVSHIWYAVTAFRLSQRFHLLSLKYLSVSKVEHGYWNLYISLVLMFTSTFLSRWERFGLIDLPEVFERIFPAVTWLSLGLLWRWWFGIHRAANALARHARSAQGTPTEVPELSGR